MNRPTPRRLRTVLLPAVSAAVVALTVSACQTQSPSQTLVPYQPADGVAVDNGPVQARNLVLLASDKGQTGVLSGSLINTTTEEVQVAFSAVAAAGATASPTSSGSTSSFGDTVTLAPRQQKQLEGVQIANVPAPPGALAGVLVSTSAGDKIVQVPVLLPDGIYATFTPTEPPESHAPTGTSTGTSTPTSTSS